MRLYNKDKYIKEAFKPKCSECLTHYKILISWDSVPVATYTCKTCLTKAVKMLGESDELVK